MAIFQKVRGLIGASANAGLRMRSFGGIVFVCLAACASGFAWANEMAGYETVRIVAPQDDATVHDNQGALEISVEVSPPLRAEAGDYIVLLLDGKAAASGAKARFRLTRVDRGTHTLRAQVAAADGALLLASPQIRFHMWRASRLFPDRKN